MPNEPRIPNFRWLSPPICESSRYDPLANMMPLSFRWRVDSNRCRMRIERKLMELVLGELVGHLPWDLV